MRGSAGKRSTNAAWCASNQRGVASCRAGRFIHQDPGYSAHNATRKIPFFSLLSLARPPRPFETCEENDGGREWCSPLISRRFENVWHVPRPCNAWIVQGVVVVCEVECCFDTEGVILRWGDGDGRKRCSEYLVRLTSFFGMWKKFVLVKKLVKPGISCLYVGSRRSFHLVVPENFKMCNKISSNINLEILIIAYW